MNSAWVVLFVHLKLSSAAVCTQACCTLVLAVSTHTDCTPHVGIMKRASWTVGYSFLLQMSGVGIEMLGGCDGRLGLRTKPFDSDFFF